MPPSPRGGKAAKGCQGGYITKFCIPQSPTVTAPFRQGGLWCKFETAREIGIYRGASNLEYLSKTIVGTPLLGCPFRNTNGFCGHPRTGVPTFSIRRALEKLGFGEKNRELRISSAPGFYSFLRVRYCRGVSPVSFLNRRAKFRESIPTASATRATLVSVSRRRILAFRIRRAVRY